MRGSGALRSRGAYGNTGFYMIALVVESISGMSFQEFLEREFFEPLDMENTGDRFRLAAREDDGLATPYQPGPPPELLRQAPYASPTLALGAGSLYSTGEDLAAWGLAVIEDRFVDLDRQDYPWGWGTDEYAGRNTLNQTGMTAGYASALYLVPEYRADGQLYLTLNEWPVWRHLLTLADGGFQLRDFSGRVLFVDEDGDGLPDLLRHENPPHWGGDPQIYRRVPANS